MTQVGAHVSTAGGLVNGLIRAEELDINTMQIFGSSPRQWSVRMPSAQDVSAYLEKQSRRLVDPVFLHAPYLINLAAADEHIRQKSIQALKEHLAIAEKIKAQGLVFHLGSSTGLKQPALNRTAQGMTEALKGASGPFLIIENSAGGKNKIGVSPAEIGFICRAVKSNRVKVCLDTAHAFQAGVFHFNADRIGRYLEDWEDKLGLDNIQLLHVNDSATDFNSRRDRHANIGDGFIGLDGFKTLADSVLANCPWILEVPGLDNRGPDRENIERLRGCCRG